eukprot:s1753_g6.t1
MHWCDRRPQKGYQVRVLPVSSENARLQRQQQRAVEQRPLATREQVFGALRDSATKVQNGSNLNERQTAALQRGLQRPFSMVQGPPGTGKTSFLVQFIVAALSVRSAWARPDLGRILVCAPSNHAADHILDRLEVPAHLITRASRTERSFEIQPHLEEHALHFKVNDTSQLRMAPAAAQNQRAYNKGYEAAEVRVLNQSKIGTRFKRKCRNLKLYDPPKILLPLDPPKILRPVKFETIVVDEAAQAPEPDVVLPSTCATTRVVVVGDHKQLGPVVPERNLCAPYVSILETPFLERMLKNPRRWEASTMLNMQYRMHPSIRSFPSSQFYDSKLEDSVSIPHRPELSRIWPHESEHRRFIDCQTPQSLGLSPELNRACDAALMENKTSLKNVGEAKACVALCSLLLQARCSAKDIAIITPYRAWVASSRAQQYEIRGRLQRDIGEGSKSILVGTVHSLQGSERDFILISFVRSIADDVQDVAKPVQAASLGDSLALQETGHLEDQGTAFYWVMLLDGHDRRHLELRASCVQYMGQHRDDFARDAQDEPWHPFGQQAAQCGPDPCEDFHDLIQDLKRRRCLISREDFLQPSRAPQRWGRHRLRRSLNA